MFREQSVFVSAEFPSIPDTFLSAVKNGEVAVHADIHLETPNQKHGAAHQNGEAPLCISVVQWKRLDSVKYFCILSPWYPKGWLLSFSRGNGI